MFNVRNMSGRNLAIMLEKGGSIMRPNAHLDMDKLCSRKWIASNPDFRKLLRTGHLQLVHDSYATLAGPPIKDIRHPVQVTVAPKKVAARAAPAQVVDLASMPDVEVDEEKCVLHLPVEKPQAVEAKVAQEEILIADEEKIESVGPVGEDPPPVDVKAVEEEATPVPVKNDVFGGFESSRTPKLKRRKHSY